MGYLDKEYSYSELETLYTNAKEYCESRDSQYSIFGTMAKNYAMKKATRVATKGAAGVVAGVTGTNKEDVQNLMIGAGQMSGIGKAVRKGRMRRAMGDSMIGRAVAPLNRGADKLMGIKPKVNPIGTKIGNSYMQDVAAVTGHKAKSVVSTAKTSFRDIKSEFKKPTQDKIQTLPKDGSNVDKAIKENSTSPAAQQNIKDKNKHTGTVGPTGDFTDNRIKNKNREQVQRAKEFAQKKAAGSNAIAGSTPPTPTPTSDTSQGGISSAKVNKTPTSNTNQSSDTSQGGISSAKVSNNNNNYGPNPNRYYSEND